jgi:hypothetical protein
LVIGAANVDARAGLTAPALATTLESPQRNGTSGLNNQASTFAGTTQVAAVDFHDAAPDPGRPDGYGTMVRMRSCRKMTTIIDRAFDEDRVRIEAIQLTMDAFERNSCAASPRPIRTRGAL